ncbi:MAG: ligand-binding sensor domain-containing protein, partial [Methanomicrobiales archaeon]
ASLPLPAGAPAFGHVRSIAAGNGGEIRVAHDGGIACYAGGVWDAAPGRPPFSRALALTAAPDGSMLAGTPDGVWRLGETGWTREVDAGVFGLQDCEVLMTDSRGWTWAGCANPTAGGILVCRDGAWERVGEDGLPHPVVRGLCEDASGRIWAATGFASRGGAAVFDGVTVTATYTTAEGLAGGATRTVFGDAAGRMWIASEYDGVAVLFPDGTWQYLDRGCGLAGDEVKAVAEDADGRLWIGTDLGLNVAEGFERFPLRTARA